MNPHLTEMTEAEAMSVVGGKGQLLASNKYLSVNADAGAKSDAKTNFTDTGYPQTSTKTKTRVTDNSSYSESRSSASIFYSDSPI